MGEKKHILMVDDVTTNLKCVAEILRDKYELSLAKSGEQALRFLERSSVDLILLDINMPGMSGYETFERLQTIQDRNSIPVIFLTGETDQQSEIKGLRMGARDFIHKPIDPMIMFQRIENVLTSEDAKKQLEFSNRIDVLTNLWNRSRLEEVVDDCGTRDLPMGVFMMMDMDNFKAVNDNFGHLTGDAVLIKFAETLQHHARRDDIVCRLGGDEFAAFFVGNLEMNVIREKAESIIRDVTEEVNAVKGEGHDVSVSIGISKMPDDGTSFLELYQKADKALYYVKQNGKSSYHFYQEEENYHTEKRDKKDSLITMEQLNNYIEEKVFSNGAYQVEYNGFRRIYQFINRCVSRSQQDVQVVLFTLNPEDPSIDFLRREAAMRNMENCVTYCLRRGDVGTQYSGSQYVVILMDATLENSKMVVDRIIKYFYSQIGHDDFTVNYEIQTVKKM